MPGAQDKGWPRGPLTDTAPGAVRFPTYDEAMADARRLLWHGIDTRPSDRTVIIAVQIPDAPTHHWQIRRVTKSMSSTLYGLHATHWCEDTIGQPVGLAMETASR